MRMLEHKGYLTRADIGKKKRKDNAFYDVHAASITGCPEIVVSPRSKRRRSDCANASYLYKAIIKAMDRISEERHERNNKGETRLKHTQTGKV
jgi:hypothetical protein